MRQTEIVFSLFFLNLIIAPVDFAQFNDKKHGSNKLVNQHGNESAKIRASIARPNKLKYLDPNPCYLAQAESTALAISEKIDPLNGGHFSEYPEPFTLRIVSFETASTKSVLI